MLVDAAGVKKGTFDRLVAVFDKHAETILGNYLNIDFSC